MNENPPHASITASPGVIAKVANPAWCTLAATVFVYVVNRYFKVEVPPDVALAAMGLIALLVGYLTPLKQREIKS
jgi:xanthosine utilization system XapX-like protein